MAEFDRRSGDPRIIAMLAILEERIAPQVDRMRIILEGEHGDNGLCSKVTVNSQKISSVQCELTEHKEFNETEHKDIKSDIWKWVGIFGAIIGLVLAKIFVL